jgi:TetR/AcrR family transcriptional regulator, cholesterol catabolism regulator
MFKRTLQEKKDYIAKKAAEVFVEKGYKSASLQDIADRVNISKAGIYHYFKTKDEILYYILVKGRERYLEVMNECISDCKEKGLTAEDSFKNLVFAYARYINSERELRLIVLRERHQLTGKYSRGLVEFEKKIFRTLRDELKKITDENTRHDLNLIAFIIIAFSHWMGYWVREDGKLGQDEIINQFISVIFEGFK